MKVWYPFRTSDYAIGDQPRIRCVRQAASLQISPNHYIRWNLERFGEIWSQRQKLAYSEKFVLQKVFSDITLEIPGAWSESHRWVSNKVESTFHYFWRDLERFGEIGAYPAHRISRLVINSIVRGPRGLPHFPFKKIIMAKAFRAWKWRQF